MTYTFYVTDSYSGLPVDGAQCSIVDRYEMPFEGIGCITNYNGTCGVEPLFPPNYYSVYKAGYEIERGTVPGTTINVALLPTELQYWVFINAGVGGSVAPSGTFQVKANTRIIVTATPEAGYVLKEWLINGIPSGNTNPLGVLIDKDNFSVAAVFKEEAAPPPPPPPPEWPVIRRLHAFDGYHLKAEWWDISKKKTWPGPVNVDLSKLLGGKLEYTVSYIQGAPIAEVADIYFNGSRIVRERINKGETKTGSYELTGSIFSQNTTTIGIDSFIGISSEVMYDVWITLGYSEDPVIDPGVGPEYEWWWPWAIAGGVSALAIVGTIVLYQEMRQREAMYMLMAR